MSSKSTFAETSLPENDIRSLYTSGTSISEIADTLGRSYTYTRNHLLQGGTALRGKDEATRLYISRHPEWAKQFIRYEVRDRGVMTNEKMVLLTMVITEGYTDDRSFGFTNTQPALHEQFRALVSEVYGDVVVGHNKLTSRVSSREIVSELRSMMETKAFSHLAFEFINSSKSLAARVLRVVADAEGSMIISVKKAKNNFTAETRIVLASTNRLMKAQVQRLLDTLGVGCRISKNGVEIGRGDDIARFIKAVGFTPGVKVVRKKAGNGVWYGHTKSGLSQLFLKLRSEQTLFRSRGLRGCFATSTSRTQTIQVLEAWYRELQEVV